MDLLFLVSIFFLSNSAIFRNDDFCLCKSTGSMQNNLETVMQFGKLNPPSSHSFLDTLPALNLCFNRKLLPIPRSKPNLKLAITLLLCGDVSLNPGPSGNRSLRLATVNVRSIREKTASVTDLIVTKKIDILTVTETWLRTIDTKACLAEITPPPPRILAASKTKIDSQGWGRCHFSIRTLQN